MMVEKNAEMQESWVVDEMIGVRIEQMTSDNGKHDEQDRQVRVERLSNNVLAMSVHQSQLWRIMSSLQANGIEPYRCLNNDTCLGEYELLYIASENPQTDLVRYQKIIDSAA